jgi:hypothetical protein
MGRPMVMVGPERPPLDLTVNVQTPAGVRTRWSPADAKHPENQPTGLGFSTAAPGGFSDANCTLTRDPRRSYHDMELLSDIKIRGLGGALIAYEGRVATLPDTGGSTSEFTPTFVGYQAALDDDSSAAMIYIDASLSNWVDPPLGRQKALNLASVKLGSEAVGTDAADQPALILENDDSWTTILPDAEAFYDGGPTKIAKLYWQNAPNSVTDSNWIVGVFRSADGTTLLSSSAVAFNSHGIYAPADAERFFGIQMKYGSPNHGVDGTQYQTYWNLVVLGNHGLAVRGTWPGAIGLLGTDIIAHAVQTWAPELNLVNGGGNTTIIPSTFSIPQLAITSPTTASDIIKQAAAFELLDWFVYDHKTFYCSPYGQYPRARNWRARVGECQLQEAGPSATTLYNGVVVIYTAVDGTTQMVGPPGSGAQTTSASLIDTDPQNPANQAVDLTGKPKRKWGLVTMGDAVAASAIQTGARFLQAQKELDTSGTATVTGWVQDDRGVYWPAYMMRAGDTLSVIDARDSSPRRIVSTSYDDASKANSISLDQPPDALDALLQRLSIVLTPFGLA